MLFKSIKNSEEIMGKIADKDYFLVDGEVTAELEVGVSGTLLVRKGQPISKDLIDQGIEGVEELPADPDAGGADEDEAEHKNDQPESENKSGVPKAKKK
jgi:hypothetical protein